MPDPGWAARRASGFGAALAAATGLISLLPRRPASTGPDPDAEGPAKRKLPPARREPRDVTFRQMAVGGVGVVIFVAAAAGAARWLAGEADKTLRFQLPVTYPAPQLQPDPVADMNRFREEQLRQLNGIYWLDKAGGVVHLPIEDAMRIVARDGIPDWPKAPYPPVVPAR